MAGDRCYWPDEVPDVEDVNEDFATWNWNAIGGDPLFRAPEGEDE